jgi:hypothetical protein
MMKWIWKKKARIGKEPDGTCAGKEGRDVPKGLLHAADIVHVPILLRDILLTNGNSRPSDAHLGDAIDIVLIKVNLQGTEVVGRPLSQTPLLHQMLGGLQLHELAGDVSVKNRELAAGLGALELARRAPRERGNALRVRESVVQLLGGGAELVGRRHGRGVDGGFARRRAGCLARAAGGLLLRLRMDLCGGKPAGWIDAGGVLQVLAVLGNQGWAEFGQCLAQLGYDFGAHQVLDWLLGSGVGVVLDLELIFKSKIIRREDFRGKHTTNSSSSVSWATSGMLIEPVTSSASVVLPIGIPYFSCLEEITQKQH